jgi:hypothetical protein
VCKCKYPLNGVRLQSSWRFKERSAGYWGIGSVQIVTVDGRVWVPESVVVVVAWRQAGCSPLASKGKERQGMGLFYRKAEN